MVYGLRIERSLKPSATEPLWHLGLLASDIFSGLTIPTPAVTQKDFVPVLQAHLDPVANWAHLLVDRPARQMSLPWTRDGAQPCITLDDAIRFEKNYSAPKDEVVAAAVHMAGVPGVYAASLVRTTPTSRKLYDTRGHCIELPAADDHSFGKPGMSAAWGSRLTKATGVDPLAQEASFFLEALPSLPPDATIRVKSGPVTCFEVEYPDPTEDIEKYWVVQEAMKDEKHYRYALYRQEEPGKLVVVRRSERAGARAEAVHAYRTKYSQAIKCRAEEKAYLKRWTDFLGEQKTESDWPKFARYWSRENLLDDAPYSGGASSTEAEWDGQLSSAEESCISPVPDAWLRKLEAWIGNRPELEQWMSTMGWLSSDFDVYGTELLVGNAGDGETFALLNRETEDGPYFLIGATPGGLGVPEETHEELSLQNSGCQFLALQRIGGTTYLTGLRADNEDEWPTKNPFPALFEKQKIHPKTVVWWKSKPDTIESDNGAVGGSWKCVYVLEDGELGCVKAQSRANGSHDYYVAECEQYETVNAAIEYADDGNGDKWQEIQNGISTGHSAA